MHPMQQIRLHDDATLDMLYSLTVLQSFGIVNGRDQYFLCRVHCIESMPGGNCTSAILVALFRNNDAGERAYVRVLRQRERRQEDD
jgi:hypothetical protein